MRLKDLVTIDNRFEKSVNLLLDLNDKRRVTSYIPTRSSIKLLEGYLRGVAEYQGGRANILIGPYGKGKSHLLLVLLSILSGKNSNELDKLFEKIYDIDKEIAELADDINKTYKFLRVVINTNSGNLGQAFVRSLNQALKREGLHDVVPENYFSAALDTINRWEEAYPSTYVAFQEYINISVDEVRKKLESYDYDMLDSFRNIYPLITSGSNFNPLIDDETISVYQSVNRTLCEKYGYSGIFVVFDEFSKYIEGHTEKAFSADMKLLQDICELCESSKEEQMHLVCVAHKAIRAYGDSLPKNMMNAFRGVEGRLTEIPFIVSSQNNYELIADVLKKESSFYTWKQNKDFNEMIKESYMIPEYSTLFNCDDFQKIVAEGCFPLPPLSTLLLIKLSEKVAQNERTLFTFLTSQDIHGLSTYVAEQQDISYAGAALIYDYFLPLFQGEKDTVIHSEWLKTEYALSKTTVLKESAIIKALGVIRMINMSDDIPANSRILRLSLGMDNSEFNSGIESLVDKSIISFKKKDSAFEFTKNIGIDIDGIISDTILKHFQEVNLPSVLNDICRNKYVLPKKYNQDHYMTRYFRIIFMNAESFLRLSSVDYLSDPHEPDGYLVIICLEKGFDYNDLIQHMQDIPDQSIVLSFIDGMEKYKESTQNLLAIQRILKDESLLSENEVLITELNLLEKELVDRINEWIEDSKRLIEFIYTSSQKVKVGRYGINRALSDICEELYCYTPLINHELINRHSISAQVSKARNIIMDDMLNKRIMDKYETGTSAEATIYRALLIHTKKDKYLIDIHKEILEFIHESKGKKVPFSRIINKLITAPYGMRRGPIPIFILQQINELQDMPVIYQGNKELGIDPGLMSSVVQNPDDYQLYVEVETGQKLEYIEKLELLYEGYGEYCGVLEGRNRLSRLSCIMQSWYRSLPQAAVTFKKEDFEGQNIRRIQSFRKLFSGSVNPRELLFERLPNLFKKETLDETYEAIAEIKDQLDSHTNFLKESAIAVVRTALSLDSNDNLLMGIKAWYEKLDIQIKNSLFSRDSHRLFTALKNLDVSDAETIIELLSKEITGFFVEDWSDQSLGYFETGFTDLLEEINKKNINSNHVQGQKVVFASEGDIEECFFEFDPDHISPSGYFFQNALDDIVDEYGDSIENNEKIGILIQMIKKLMG